MRLALCVLLLFLLDLSTSTAQDTGQNVHLQQAEKAFQNSKYEESIENYKLAIQDFKQQKNFSGLALAHRNLGRAYRNVGRFNEAIVSLQEAIKIHNQLGAASESAVDLTFLAIANQRKGNYEEALSLSEKALTLHKEFNNEEHIARNLENIGNINYRKAAYNKAIEYFSQALEISKKIKNDDLTMIILANLSPVYGMQREFDKAIEHSKQAEEIAKEIKDDEMLAVIVGNRSILYADRGEYAEALKAKEYCLAIFQKTGSLQHQANTYMGIGSIQLNLGNYGKAQEAYQKSLELAERMDDKGLKGDVLRSIAELHLELKNHQTARDYIQKCLQVTKETGEKLSTAAALKIFSMIQTENGDYDAALNTLKQMLNLGSEMQDQNIIASSLYQIGVTNFKIKNYDQALENSQKARELWQKADAKPQVGKCELIIGSIYFAKRNLALADEALQKAILLLGETGELADLWRAFYKKGLLDRDLGKNGESILSMKKAIEVIDQIRADVSLPEQRSMFLEDKLDAYEDLIALLIQSGNNAEAFHYVQRSKARAFLDLLAESRIDPQSHLQTESYQKKKRLLAELVNVNKSIREEYESEPVNRSYIRDLEKARRNLDDEYTSLLLEIRKQNPEYSDLQAPKPLEISEARELIDEETALLEYYIGKNKSYCFVITSDDVRIFNLPSEKKLNDEVRQIIDVIQKPDLIWETTSGAYQQYAKLARSLYDSLLAPAANQLRGKQRIILAPDGMLNYLPYESLLTSGGESKQIHFSTLPYLALQYEVEYVPSITVLSAIKSIPKTSEDDRQELIAFANPASEASQPGLKKEITPINRGVRNWPQRLEQLPYAAKEVEYISKLFPKDKTALFVGVDASERNVKTMNLSQYRIVHFASHGMIEEQQPQFSSLLLSGDTEEDGYLTMREVFDLKLNADLVVLSACKTGLGQRIRGEGMTGLARSFFAAGASSVLVSLWNIYDRSTSDFIATFYNQMQTSRLSKSAALKETRRKMIESQKFSHPYYWAPFILIGN